MAARGSNADDLRMYMDVNVQRNLGSSSRSKGKAIGGRGRKSPSAAKKKPKNGSPSPQPLDTSSGGGGGGAPAAEDGPDMGFYFKTPKQMMNKLDKSKPVRQTRTEKNKEHAGKDATENDQQSGYLFKWKRSGPPDGEVTDEDEPDDAISTKPTRWMQITGNLPPSSLSIAIYLGKTGLKNKQFRPAMDQGAIVSDLPGLGSSAPTKEEIRDGSNRKGLEGFDLGLVNLDPESARKALNWPPEAPKFPPPPPATFESVKPT